MNFEIAKETIIPLIYRGVREIAQRIYNFKWKIIYIRSQERGFITSDKPFFAIPDGHDFENMSLHVSIFVHGARFIVSFTPNICIFMHEGNNDLDLQVPFHDELNKINKLIAKNSHDYIYSHNKKLLKRVVERAELTIPV